MSERDENKQYAAWWEPIIVLLVLALIGLFIAGRLESQIRDLQRRVGQLESERR